MSLSPSFLIFDTVESTNDTAKRLAVSDPDFAETIIWAKAQTKGRGRYGREWASLEGNLYFSILLRPEPIIANPLQLSLLSGLAIKRVLSRTMPAETLLHLKWPNDVLINKKKAGGILIESGTKGCRLQWVVVGIGVNIRNHPSNTSFPATSLNTEGFQQIEERSLILAIFEELKLLLTACKDQQFAVLRQNWLDSAYKIGEMVTVSTEKQSISGIFKGIDENGAMIMEMKDGSTHVFNAGEIFPADNEEDAYAACS
ncbi:MAG: biotin--[acetyl-CoA-carboxylase] ligase [Rectinemataceae bacterium]|nr:biotin--[acetyl-CoA-carboxylase] ligase [Rectinemataceae bacterium]